MYLRNFFIRYGGSLHPEPGKMRATRYVKTDGPYFSIPIFVK